MDYGLSKLERAIGHASVTTPAVSAWSVGMHVHHCLLATTGVCRSLIDSEPPVPDTPFSFARTFVMTTGRIPRGRGRSPDVVLPRSDVPEEELLGLLSQARELTGAARLAPEDRWFRHFAFGVFGRDDTLKFIRIHNHHHARIIDDILARV